MQADASQKINGLLKEKIGFEHKKIFQYSVFQIW